MSNETATPEVRCPKCGSNQIFASKKGFSGKKAVAGAVLTGGIGLLAGTIGSNKIKITCLACNHVFSPGDTYEKPVGFQAAGIIPKFENEFETQLAAILREKGYSEACKFYAAQKDVDMSGALHPVNEFQRKYSIIPATSAGAKMTANIILAIFGFIIIVFFMKACS